MSTMDTPLVELRFFETQRGTMTWDLTRAPDATRLWFHVPVVGDRVVLDDSKADAIRFVVGRVAEVVWENDGVSVLLK